MVLGFLFGWKGKVRGMRKKWNKLRMKALKKDEPLRSMSLKRLDAINDNLEILEERELSRIDKARISKDAEIGLEEIKALLKSKPEEVRALQATQATRQAKR